jgi:hypothetical protein
MKRVTLHLGVYRGPLALAGLSGSILLGLAVGMAGAQHNSKLTNSSDQSTQTSSTSVASDTASEPSIVIDGTQVPVGTNGQTSVETNDGPANVTVSGNNVSVVQNKTNSDTSGNGSTQLNVSSTNTTQSSASTGWNGNTSTTTQSQQNVYSHGVSSVQKSH